jgi:hypothetical protein
MVGIYQLCKTEIYNYQPQVYIKQNVISFDVSVNDVGINLLVEEGNPLGNVVANYAPDIPTEVGIAAAGTHKIMRKSYYQDNKSLHLLELIAFVHDIIIRNQCKLLT